MREKESRYLRPPSRRHRSGVTEVVFDELPGVALVELADFT
jgi:hypothetical protein